MRLKKETPLKNGNKLLAYWANNRGRGNDNCTLIVVRGDYMRPAYTRMIADADTIARCRVSSWAGDVNLSRKIQSFLGIEL
jgi:hypothetical protein